MDGMRQDAEAVVEEEDDQEDGCEQSCYLCDRPYLVPNQYSDLFDPKG